LAVDLHGGGRLTGIHSDRRVDRGSAVGLRLETAGCVVFAAEDEGAPAPGEPAEAAAVGEGTS
jgi:hypothetical protein